MMHPADNFDVRIERWIDADARTLFDAWTNPERLVRWWGPQGVHCPEAQIDLREGGKFSIANQLPDGRIGIISGEYKVIDPPHFLSYTWHFSLMTDPTAQEQVEVWFTEEGGRTKVTIRHTSIPDAMVQKDHQQGWIGCLDKLRVFAEEKSRI